MYNAIIITMLYKSKLYMNIYIKKIYKNIEQYIDKHNVKLLGNIKQLGWRILY